MGTHVSDPLYGLIELNDLQADLLKQPEVQRLAGIKQLSFTYLVYPGAHGTRLEHSIGASYLAGKIAKALHFSEENKKLLEAAAFLHDLGHGPYSHIVEPVMSKNHVHITYDFIVGKEKLSPTAKSGKIPELLKSYGLVPEEVGALVLSAKDEPTTLQQLINGTVDVDQLDYLPRDALYTGVKQGVIGLERIIQTLVMHEGRLAIQEKGRRALEHMLMARLFMYAEVYFHHAVRIAGLMLLRTMEAAKVEKKLPDNFYLWRDEELLTNLAELGEYQRETVNWLRCRQLFKCATIIEQPDLPRYRVVLEHLQKTDEHTLERQIAEATGIRKEDVIVDFPKKFLEDAEPRIKKVDFYVLRKNGEVRSLKDMSPIAKTILSEESSSSSFGVYTPEEHREKVRRVVEGMLA